METTIIKNFDWYVLCKGSKPVFVIVIDLHCFIANTDTYVLYYHWVSNEQLSIIISH